MEEKQILQLCYHCGNKGLLQIDCCDTLNYNDYVDDVPISWIEDNYIILKCPVCNEITLLKRTTTSYKIKQDGTFEYDDKILYPIVHTNNLGVPRNIVTALESAKKVQKIDTSICALSLRRVIELICLDKKANGNNLVNMVKDLVNKNILPSTFDNACEIIRIIGNEGAHDNNLSIPKHELNTLIEFVESIINYLYIIPEKIKKLKKIKTSNHPNSI